MSGHAFLAPSAAARWVACPGSALMASRYPEQGDKEAAAEGEAAHWCAQQIFEGWAPEVLLRDGRTDKGHPVTLEMIEGAQMLVDDVRDTLAPFGAVPIVEKPLTVPRVHSACWGTPDVRAWTVMPAAFDRTLYLWDYKHGHKHVEIFENWQLICYAAGCLSEENANATAEGRNAVPESRITVVLRVVQPRSYHRDGPIREWRVNALDLRDYVHRLNMAAMDATQPEPECKPQADACENCNARHACDALQRAAYRGMDLARQAQASDLTPAAIGLELRYLNDAAALIKARTTGLQAQAEGLIRQGVAVPHWMMAPAGGRLSWTKSAAEILALGEMVGVPLAKEAEPITPTQAKAMGFPPDLVGAYSATKSGAVRLELDDGSAARKVFAKSV
jgi:hypothetical protein